MRCSAIKRAAALRELAELGCHKARAAKLLRITRTQVERLCRRHSINIPNKCRVTELTWKRVAALREMADLGLIRSQAAVLLDIDLVRVGQLVTAHKIPMRRAPNTKPGWLRSLILRDFGKPGITHAIMAKRYGATENSVAVTIHQLRKEGKLPPVQQRC